jgi:hypothetical protein
MTTAIKQHELEITWSTKIVDEIILGVIQGELPLDMETSILQNITAVNRGKKSNKEIFIKFFSLILKDKIAKPIQAIAAPLGYMSGTNDPLKEINWGMFLLKACKNSGLYTLMLIDETDWYVHPNLALDKKTKYKINKLQYLPPMKIIPKNWSNNTNGGWLWESKHLVLGTRFTKHNKPLAYDVINKLQSIPWEIDSDTYLFEKQTNRRIDKTKFLRVINESLGNPFYFVWRYDSRGRSYSSGYHLNLQTDEYGKSLISLHNKEKITNLSNLHIAIANHAGKDKLTWKEREKWFLSQKVDDISWKEPILGRKALRALADTKAGKSSGYVMSLDATSSGIQIMAVISGCKETAKLVNCIDSTKRYDIYSQVADLMNAHLSKPVPRIIAKEVTMTHFFNSRAMPKSLLSKEALSVFYKIITGLFPGAEDVMKSINACWNTKENHHTWIMPDGHTVYVPVVEGTNLTYSDSEFGEVPFRYNHQTSSDDFRSLCPNVVHSIDGYIAREMIRNCHFQLSHIHDCFVFSPNHLQEVTATYREIMANIAKSNIFEDILQQITGNSALKVNKLSDDLYKDILKSSYMLS